MFSNEIVINIIKYIKLNINTKFSIDDLVNYTHYNRYYIMRLFKKELNISIFNYINLLRIYNSTFDIKNTNNSFLNIAIKNGFYSEEYFSEIFKKVLGVNPKTYKKIINHNSSIKEKDYDLYLKNYSIILDYLNKIDKYEINIKPKTNPIKNLTIFK